MGDCRDGLAQARASLQASVSPPQLLLLEASCLTCCLTAHVLRLCDTLAFGALVFSVNSSQVDGPSS